MFSKPGFSGFSGEFSCNKCPALRIALGESSWVVNHPVLVRIFSPLNGCSQYKLYFRTVPDLDRIVLSIESAAGNKPPWGHLVGTLASVVAAGIRAESKFRYRKVWRITIRRANRFQGIQAGDPLFGSFTAMQTFRRGFPGYPLIAMVSGSFSTAPFPCTKTDSIMPKRNARAHWPYRRPLL